TELVGTNPAPHEELVGLSTPQERAVARLAGYREGMTVHPTTKDEPLFYEDFVLKEPIIIDPAFANGHGQMIHTTHDLIAAAAFEREGIALTGFQWRQSLNNPALSPRAQALQKQLWAEIFDSLEVAPNARGDNVGTLNRPETLNPILDQILGGLNKP
ncbi:MAG TPA: hypothetical protein VEX15_09470, partial [Nocardioidaceae bacterium]|nr:hypothetical protein [Nocardioidaceae bacterium]